MLYDTSMTNPEQHGLWHEFSREATAEVADDFALFAVAAFTGGSVLPAAAEVGAAVEASSAIETAPDDEELLVGGPVLSVIPGGAMPLLDEVVFPDLEAAA